MCALSSSSFSGARLMQLFSSKLFLTASFCTQIVHGTHLILKWLHYPPSEVSRWDPSGGDKKKKIAPLLGTRLNIPIRIFCYYKLKQNEWSLIVTRLLWFLFSLGWFHPPVRSERSSSVCHNGLWPVGMPHHRLCWRSIVCSWSWNVLICRSSIRPFHNIWSSIRSWCISRLYYNVQGHLAMVWQVR